MLEELKKKIVEIALDADKNGLCRHKSGNFSIRDEKTGYIAITPSGVSRYDLTYHDICVVDIDANIIEIETAVKPTSEILMHLQAYRTRKDVHAIVHTHSRFATTFAILGREIPAVAFEAIHYGGKVPVAPYGRPGTPELAKSIIEPVKHSDACLLERHGVLTLDSENLDNALLKAYYVEQVAELYYRTLQISGGKEPAAFTEDEFKAWKYPQEVKL